MGSAGVATKGDPRLWTEAKTRACSDAGLCLHSARKMQWATRYYKAHGGTYVGRRAPNKLARWSRQKWRTSDGRPSKGVRRYLPSEAWDRLTPDQVRRTNASKRRGFVEGKQYVRQPADVVRTLRRSRPKHERTRATKIRSP